MAGFGAKCVFFGISVATLNATFIGPPQDEAPIGISPTCSQSEEELL